MGLCFFPLVEIALVMFHVNPELGVNMGNYGLETKVPLFNKSKSNGTEYWRPSQKWFGKMRYYQGGIARDFEMPKPAQPSASWCSASPRPRGYPFGPDAAFPKWLEVMLNASGSGCRYEVLNLGINGIASYELKMLLPQALSAQPDLVVFTRVTITAWIKRAIPEHQLDGVLNRLSRDLLRFRTYRLVFSHYHNDHTARRKAVFRYYAELRRRGRRRTR